jgi:hypothetical protein
MHIETHSFGAAIEPELSRIDRIQQVYIRCYLQLNLLQSNSFPIPGEKESRRDLSSSSWGMRRGFEKLVSLYGKTILRSEEASYRVCCGNRV